MDHGKRPIIWQASIMKRNSPTSTFLVYLIPTGD